VGIIVGSLFLTSLLGWHGVGGGVGCGREEEVDAKGSSRFERGAAWVGLVGRTLS
jgi:hypothetical protein